LTLNTFHIIGVRRFHREYVFLENFFGKFVTYLMGKNKGNKGVPIGIHVVNK